MVKVKCPVCGKTFFTTYKGLIPCNPYCGAVFDVEENTVPEGK